jgi:hypothetical protein
LKWFHDTCARQLSLAIGIGPLLWLQESIDSDSSHVFGEIMPESQSLRVVYQGMKQSPISALPMLECVSLTNTAIYNAEAQQ